jgi:hypothetical protein
MPPTYRERLRAEGLVLAASGVLGSAGLLVFLTDEATSGPVSTVVQLAIVAALLGWLGPLSARTSIARSEEVAAGDEGTGEPTALWLLPLIVAALAGAFAALVGWDAALRVTGGCTLVGLAQAVLLERIVAADEARRGRVYFRRPGSRILRGTLLGHRPRG